MLKIWKTPAGESPVLYVNMLAQPHLLIAGATGSGKSVAINGIMHSALFNSPARTEFILIDPKRVELCEYKRLPHTLYYASEPQEMVRALEYAIQITETRYKAMQRQGKRKSDSSDAYIIIDELADLMTTNKRQVQPLVQRICQIGRAARVHVIAATQCPLASVIPTPIKVNFDARLGLRTRSAQDSRNILGYAGLETLPRYGQGVYMTPDENTLYNIPMIPDDERQRLIDYWTHTKPRIKLFA